MREKWGVPKLRNYDDLRGNWNGCLLVNPLCPDDLCWLPAESHQHMWHCLGTDPWDYRFTVGDTAMYMSKTAVTQEDLIQEGWFRQLDLFPADREFRRLTNPDLVRAWEMERD